MNPVFWFLVLVILVGFWFGSSILFKPLGGWLYRVFNDTKEILNEEDREKEEK